MKEQLQTITPSSMHEQLRQKLRLELRLELRQTLRQKRKKITSSQQKLNAHQLAKQIIQLKEIQSAKNIAVYLSNDGEIDLQEVVSLLWQANKNCYLPVLNKENKGHLLFLAYTKQQQLVKNCFNILEPAYQQEKSKIAKQMDVILMPLVGFDKDCKRIGMGGGYYDRSLSFISHKTVKPVLIGVAHSIQQVEKIPIEKWDIGLNKIVTEKQVFTQNAH
jgi:5-formyltetrahydrofolate cyclo-ligase